MLKLNDLSSWMVIDFTVLNLFFVDDHSGASSFNQFIHDLSIDSDTASSVDYSSDEDDSDENIPGSPLSHCSRFSRASSFTKHDKHWIHWIRYILSWILLPLKFMLGIPFFFYNLSANQSSNASNTQRSSQRSYLDSPRRLQTLKDQVIQRATDRRRGVVEVCCSWPPHICFLFVSVLTAQLYTVFYSTLARIRFIIIKSFFASMFSGFIIAILIRYLKSL